LEQIFLPKHNLQENGQFGLMTILLTKNNSKYFLFSWAAITLTQKKMKTIKISNF